MVVAVSAKYRVVLNTVTWEPYYWENLRVDDDEFWEFVEENPMPKSKVYDDPEELLNDVKNAGGIVTLPCDENPEFVEWFEDFVEYFGG